MNHPLIKFFISYYVNQNYIILWIFITLNPIKVHKPIPRIKACINPFLVRDFCSTKERIENKTEFTINESRNCGSIDGSGKINFLVFLPWKFLLNIGWREDILFWNKYWFDNLGCVRLKCNLETWNDENLFNMTNKIYVINLIIFLIFQLNKLRINRWVLKLRL